MKLVGGRFASPPQLTETVEVSPRLFRGKSAAKLRLQKRANGNVCVAKLQEIKVDTTKEACLILEACRRKVRFSSSAKNQRGHCVFTIKLAKVYENSGGLSDPGSW